MDKQQGKSGRLSLECIELNAAGIDVGATEIFVAVPADRDQQPVRRFKTFTDDLRLMASWLIQCRITTVAMESTGVYWLPPYEMLEQAGIHVCLVNSQHVKHVPGRKTDVSDCQWLQYLHSVGLLRASFRPESGICAIRALSRHRSSLIEIAAMHVQHMHKALTQMNLQIHHVLSDVTGLSGMSIIEAIVAGERSPVRLAALCNQRVRSDQETVIKSLVGNYRSEHLFTLSQSLTAYKHSQELVVDCDREIERLMRLLDGKIHLPQSFPRIVERLICLAADPEMMQQNCQLAGDGDDRSFLSAFASMFGEFQSPPPQVGVLSEGPQDVLCPLNQHHPQIGISLPGDMQLRLALSGVPSARLQSCVAARITALSKSPSSDTRL